MSKCIALLKGLSTLVPPLQQIWRRRARTGGTDSARYCYSVWLRHLILARRSGLATDPAVVVEVGPGDSIGVGLTALLTGARQYYAIDHVRYANTPRDLAVFDELLDLVRDRTPLPGDEELPRVWPRLSSYAFPADILDDERIDASLAPGRAARLREAIAGAGADAGPITYAAPLYDPSVVPDGAADMVYTQAVLEHVDDLPALYAALRRWLKPDGWSSHTIDFQCHRTSSHWNGHWNYSELAWRVARGDRPYLINRKPRSTHRRLAEAAGFEVILDLPHMRDDGLPRHKLAKRWRDMLEEDLRCDFTFMQLRPVPVL